MRERPRLPRRLRAGVKANLNEPRAAEGQHRDERGRRPRRSSGSQSDPLRFRLSACGEGGCVDQERLEGIGLILRAIDLTIADLEAAEDRGDRDEQLRTLREVRERWAEVQEASNR